ncbi:hypothetical protein AGMMS50225_15960 [Betaproteobacteria bacterium]|nr:hypothetical protein AGMMS50225_15960 [Betaproteobacteria bacterium]
MVALRSLRLSPVLVALAATILLAGCAGNPLRSYDKEMQGTLQRLNSGEVDAALSNLESNNASIFSSSGDAPKDQDGEPTEQTQLDSVLGKDILYYFEKGELLKLKNDYAGSRDAWLVADEIVRVWEDEYRTNPTKVIGEVGAYLVSDRVRRYDGQDYEKVFLSTKLALDHILLGRFDLARIEMKKTFEREKLIESFRDREYDKIKEEGGKQGVETTAEELGDQGYPLDELDGPEVRALKNGFQNAFAHYLSGYFFELTGEYSLAAPGYRNALALQPKSKLIQAKVNRVGQQKPGRNEADVLFVVESGFAPEWKSITVAAPVPINRKLVATPISFPIVYSSAEVAVPRMLTAGKKTLPVETLVDVDAMARRLLKDQLPGIITRTVVRAVIKSTVQYQARKRGGVIGEVVAGIATIATEQADERAWRTLPAKLSVARAILPRGEVPISFDTGNGIWHGTITVNDRMTIVPIRVLGGQVYLGSPGSADIEEIREATGAAEPAERPAPARKKKPVKPANAKPQQES